MTVASARRSAAAAELLGDPRTVVAAIAFYLSLHFLLRFLVSPTLSLDDAEQSLFSQSLLAGYRFRQPPLYTWVLWGVSQVFGPGLLAHVLVRYLFQFACYAFVYLAALRMIGDRRLAALALAGYPLIWDFGVFIHLDLTHTVAVAAMIAASLWLFARAAEAGRIRDFAWLGLALGLGVLAKYNFALLVGAAIPAAALTPGLRTRLYRRQAWAAVVVALVVVGPYLYWAWGHGYSFGGLTATVVHSDTADFDLGARLLALATAIGKAVEFTLPFGVIAPLVLPAVLTRQPAADPQGYRRFLGLLMIVGIGILGAAALAFGASHFKARWMHPILMALPVWVFSRPDWTDLAPGRVRLYLAVVLSSVLLVMGGRIVVDRVAPDYCGSCRAYLPVADLARALRGMGFDRGTVVTQGHHLAGNLRLGLPHARIIDVDYPIFAFPPAPVDGGCLVLWAGDGEAVPAALASYMADRLGATAIPPLRQGRLEGGYVGAPNRRFVLSYAMIEGGTGSCR